GRSCRLFFSITAITPWFAPVARWKGHVLISEQVGRPPAIIAVVCHVENVFCSGCSHAADRQRVGTSGARIFVATIQQGMRELEHRGSMSAAACGAVVAEDAAADPRDHRT